MKPVLPASLAALLPEGRSGESAATADFTRLLETAAEGAGDEADAEAAPPETVPAAVPIVADSPTRALGPGIFTAERPMAREGPSPGSPLAPGLANLPAAGVPARPETASLPEPPDGDPRPQLLPRSGASDKGHAARLHSGAVRTEPAARAPEHAAETGTSPCGRDESLAPRNPVLPPGVLPSAPASPGTTTLRADRTARTSDRASAPPESALTNRAGSGPTPAPQLLPSVTVGGAGLETRPDRMVNESSGASPRNPGPSAALLEAGLPGEAAAPSGPIQALRLGVDAAARLSLTFSAATLADREQIQAETPQLAAELAAVGAKVETIRVDLSPRLTPDGRGDAAAMLHSGHGPGGGASGGNGRPQEETGPAVSGAPGQRVVPDRPAEAGGKVDRYA